MKIPQYVHLHFLLEFPTSESVLRTGEAKITRRIVELCISRSNQWAKEKAKKIMDSASRNPFKKTRYESNLVILEMYIHMILQYQEHLSNLEKQIDTLAIEIEEYKIIQSIIDFL